MITHTISVVELFWTLFALVGSIFNGRQLQRAVGDMVELRRRRINSIREYAAMTTVYMFSTWTFVQCVFVGVGFAAMTAPSPNGNIQPVSYIITIAFLAITALLAISGYVIDKRRKEIVRKINELESGFNEAT